MTNIKVEVEISLEDFFNSENQRSQVFQDALQWALISQLNNNRWFQENVAHFFFDKLKAETLQGEIAVIEKHIQQAIAEYRISKWEIDSNPVTRKAIERALEEMEPQIKERTIQLSKDYMADENRTYPSLYHSVADACVSKVFDHFVSAMVEKEDRK